MMNQHESTQTQPVKKAQSQLDPSSARAGMSFDTTTLAGLKKMQDPSKFGKAFQNRTIRTS